MTKALRRLLADDLRRRSEQLGEQILVRLRTEITDYADRDPAQLLPAVQISLDGILRPLVEGRELTGDELTAFASYGAERARQGLPAEAMLRAWRLSIRYVVDDLISTGRQRADGDREVVDLVRDLLVITDAATLAFTDGHHQVELELARRDEGQRSEFARGVLHGTLGPTYIRRLAATYGLDPDRSYHPVRSPGGEAATPGAVERRLGLVARSNQAGGPRGIVALVDGDVAGFVDRLPGTVPAFPMGIGPAVPLDQLEPSFRTATRAMTTAVAFGLTGLHDLAGLGLLPTVLADREVGAELARRYVDALGGGEGKRLILDTVRVFLNSGQRIETSAELLSVHQNTVRYRLRRYEELTGVDLRDSERVLEIWWAFQYLRLA
jgi:hypothetical protein